MGLVLRILLFELVLAGTLFGCAGRLDLPWFWVLIGVHAIQMTVAAATMDPDLRKERIRPGPGGTDRQLRWFAVPLLLGHLVVAGLDVGRFGWSGTVPLAVHVAGLIGYVAGVGTMMWAVRVNRFFSPVVRIQSERGHHVVTTGPYRYIRHPGYLGSILAAACGGLLLGSWWSLVPIAPFLLLLARRLVVEDRYLHAELEGYAAYAAQVRFRLVPGVW